jgi:small-conductance mechanosensitive channel
MQTVLDYIQSPENILNATRVGLLLFVAIPFVFLLASTIRRMIGRRVSAHAGMLTAKAIRYVGVFFILFSVLESLGFQMSHLLATAGVIGVAIGFASQTSISNIISGLFLITEQPFSIGDIVTIGATTGEVLAIDTLSVKLRTFDNRYVRIPNETIIKSEVINITHFPIRRIDVRVGVSYSENLQKVREILIEIADRNPLCLQEPPPVIILEGFGDSSINFLFGVWVEQPDFLEVKNDIQIQIKERFDSEGITIPFPQRVLHMQDGKRRRENGRGKKIQ